MRSLPRVAVVATLGAALVVGTATSASAGQSINVSTDGSYDGCDHEYGDGLAFFGHIGEHWYVHDLAADGARVTVDVYVNQDYEETLVNAQGAVTHRHFNRDYPEGAVVRADIWLKDNGELIDCTYNWYTGTA